jgi:hypothetical protein
VASSAGTSATIGRASGSIALDLLNDGREPANVAQVAVALDARAMLRGTPLQSQTVETFEFEGRIIAIRRFSFAWGGPQTFPVFEGAPARVSAIAVEALFGTGAGPFLLHWRVSAPRFSGAEGMAVFYWSQSDLSFSVQNVQDAHAGTLAVPWSMTEPDAIRAAKKSEGEHLLRRREMTGVD